MVLIFDTPSNVVDYYEPGSSPHRIIIFGMIVVGIIVVINMIKGWKDTYDNTQSKTITGIKKQILYKFDNPRRIDKTRTQIQSVLKSQEVCYFNCLPRYHDGVDQLYNRTMSVGSIGDYIEIFDIDDPTFGFGAIITEITYKKDSLHELDWMNGTEYINADIKFKVIIEDLKNKKLFLLLNESNLQQYL